MMSREDMLRELELLPVWQLRTPLAEHTLKVEKLAEIEPVEVIAEKSAYEKPLSFSEAALEVSAIELEINTAELIVDSVTQNITYRCVSSDDGAYLFMMSSDEGNEDVAILQRNMWRAMRLNMQASFLQKLDDIAFAKHKIIITMGESVAQQLLATKTLLDELRASVHQFKGVSLIATFDAAYLLQNPQYKSQAWADLCLGMQTLLDLNNEKS